MLDRRLLAAASYVRRDSRCVDVGTDHGYLAVFLYQTGITERVIACDIAQKPLEAAGRTFAEHGLYGKIELRLSNGLEKIREEEAEDIVICGMGGELILEILLNCPYLKNPNKRLILQPMTRHSFLREKLYENGFSILEETPVVDREHHYTVMQVMYTGEVRRISPLYALVGEISAKKTEEAAGYLRHLAGVLRDIAKGLAKSREQAGRAEFYDDLAQQIDMCL